MNIYLELTHQFNHERVRAILSSGQAVVFHRLAVMSKDGDWIVREDPEALDHILSVLEEHNARYRFGAPLDIRWLAGGWSSHLEFLHAGVRVRTDFVSRPPRIGPQRLGQIWEELNEANPAVVGLSDLAELKKTNREKDFAVIGELARSMKTFEDRIRYSRSARDLLEFYRANPVLVRDILMERGIEQSAMISLNSLETALDAERRRLMHANEERLLRYQSAAQQWSAAWKETERAIAGKSLREAHAIIVDKARSLLPSSVEASQ